MSQIHPDASKVGGMVGPEIVGAAAAVGKASEKVLTSSQEEQAALLSAARQSPQMETAAAEYARRLALKQATITRLFAGLARMVGIRADYFDSRFAEDLAAKTHHIPEERAREPRASVAFPAMQGLGYTLDEPELKEMYLNLLATAVDDRLDRYAHPAFAEVIKQLSPAEAAVLLDVLVQDGVAMVEVRNMGEGGSYTVESTHVLNLRHPSTGEWLRAEDSTIWVDNWIRLGLVSARYDLGMSGSDAYAWCTHHPNTEHARFEEVLTVPEDGSTVMGKGVLVVSDFGRCFALAVNPPPASHVLIVDEPTTDAAL